MTEQQVIAILGGGGALGSGIAKRLARTGYKVIIGSRDPARAMDTANALNAGNTLPLISTATYTEAAAQAGIIIVTVPFAAQRQTLEAVQPAIGSKLVIDCTVPLKPPKVGLVQLPPEGSAAELARLTLGPGARLAATLHNVSAKLLEKEGPVDGDVLVFADDDSVRAEAAQIVAALGLNPVEAGPLANAVAAEAMTSVLIQINRKYKNVHAGIKITGLSGAH